MKICVFGPSGCGKTTFCEQLISKLPEFELLQVDYYREKNTRYTLYGQQLADSIDFYGRHQIIEAVGIGVTAHLLHEKLRRVKDHVLIVVLIAHAEVIKQRGKDFSGLDYAALIEQEFQEFHRIELINNTMQELSSNINTTLQEIFAYANK